MHLQGFKCNEVEGVRTLNLRIDSASGHSITPCQQSINICLKKTYDSNSNPSKG
jgi:hypothetical protein